MWYVEMCMHMLLTHYSDVIMGAMASQITSLTIVYSAVYSGADQRKHQSSTSLAYVRGIHKWPVTRKMFPFDDVTMPSGCKIIWGFNQLKAYYIRIIAT